MAEPQNESLPNNVSAFHGGKFAVSKDGTCKMCPAPLPEGMRDLCLSEECKQRWWKLCVACKSKERVEGRFCSDQCRQVTLA